MAQSTPQYPPRAFSPHQNAGSPTGNYAGGPPAAKRPPQLSPNGQSPYNSPNMANLSLPNQVFSSPYIGNQANGIHHPPPPQYHMSPPYSSNTNFNHSPTYNSLNTAISQPPTSRSPPVPSTNNAPANVMGPPGRPDNKPTDLNELGDVVFSSGIDIREEEAALLRSQDKGEQNLSFEDQLRQASGAKYPFSRDNIYSQNVPGGRDSFYGAGTFNQPLQKEQTAEELAEAEQKKATRKKAEIDQYHMNNPFLSGANLERRLRAEVVKHHVTLPVRDADILRPQQPHVRPTQITVNGPDKHEVVKLVKGEPLLTLNSSLVEIFTLLSLAAEERMRTMVEDVGTIAKGRRQGASGLPPPDMIDLAAKKADFDTAAMLPTPDNSAVSPKDNPLKRSYSEANQLPTPPSTQNLKPPSNVVADALTRMARAELDAEEARLVKRRKRAEAAETRDRSESFSLDTSIPSTPGDVAPESTPKKSALKKDAKKAPSDAQQHAATNKTLGLALGFGGGSKKLSWMTGGQSSGPSNPYLASKKAETSKATKTTIAATGKDAPPVPKPVQRGRSFGDLREDGNEGLGIQLRDLILTLERDGKETKALQKAYMRLNRREGEVPPPTQE